MICKNPAMNQSHANSTCFAIDEPKLKLTPDESRLFGQLFKEADSDSTGFVTGEVAVNFFGRTNLPQQVLGAVSVIPDKR